MTDARISADFMIKQYVEIREVLVSPDEYERAVQEMMVHIDILRAEEAFESKEKKP